MVEDRLPLTPRQKEVLDYIRSTIEDKGYAPTRQEIANHLDVVISAAQEHVTNLERKGYVGRLGDGPRSLEVYDD